ncbi:IFT57 [Scenedesmus sp. PABB004]|nr:IFT57 [Scenedesmus sp. PABB004]
MKASRAEQPAAPPAQPPAQGLAPLRAAPQPAGRSLEAVLPEEVYMDQILNKLQLLNYEREFCRRKKPHRKPLTPNYFTAPLHQGSGGEQFLYFTSLAAWLLALCGAAVAAPKEFDDPGATLQALVGGLRALGFAPPPYPPAKLAPGWGCEACALLDGLLDAALEAQRVVLGRPVHGDDRLEAVEEDDDPAAEAADISTVAAALAADSDDDADGALAWGGTCAAGEQVPPAPAGHAAAAEASAARQVRVSTVDAVAWRLEVERVAPRLRAVAAAAGNARDWRAHLEAAHASADALAAAWPDARGALERVGGDVAASLDRVAARERQLNGQFDGLLAAYSGTRVELLEAQEEHNRCAEAISERNNELHRLAAALEEAKAALDVRGSNLADASPLVRLKAGMAALRGELQGMELRIGVVSHLLISLSLREKQAARRRAAAARAHQAPSTRPAAPSRRRRGRAPAAAAAAASGDAGRTRPQDGRLALVPGPGGGGGLALMVGTAPPGMTLDALAPAPASAASAAGDALEPLAVAPLNELLFGHLPGALTPHYLDDAEGAGGALVHVALLRLACGGAVLGLRCSHLLGDWASLRVLLRTLAATYTAAAAGRSPERPPRLPAAAPLLNALVAGAAAALPPGFQPARLKRLEPADEARFTALAGLGSDGDDGGGAGAGAPVRLSFHAGPAAIARLKRDAAAEARAPPPGVDARRVLTAHNLLLGAVARAFCGLPGRAGLPHDVAVTADMRGRLPAAALAAAPPGAAAGLPSCVGNMFASAIAEDCLPGERSPAAMAGALAAAVARGAELMLPDLAWASQAMGLAQDALAEGRVAVQREDAQQQQQQPGAAAVTWRRLHAMGPRRLLERQVALGCLPSLTTTQWPLNYAADAALAGQLPLAALPGFSSPGPFPLLLSQPAPPALGGGVLLHLVVDADEAAPLAAALAAAV